MAYEMKPVVMTQNLKKAMSANKSVTSSEAAVERAHRKLNEAIGILTLDECTWYGYLTTQKSRLT